MCLGLVDQLVSESVCMCCFVAAQFPVELGRKIERGRESLLDLSIAFSLSLSLSLSLSFSLRLQKVNVTHLSPTVHPFQQ